MPVRVTLSPGLQRLDSQLRQRVAQAQAKSGLLIETECKAQIQAVDAVASKELLHSVRVLDKTPTRTRIGSDKPQARIIEKGRKPGGKIPRWSVFRPLLALWVARKGLAIPAEKLYAVALKIARAGFRGRFPFQKATRIVAPKVRRVFSESLKGL